MHEISLMESVIALAAEYAKQQQAKTIHRICLDVGAGSGVVPESLEFAFEIVAQKTMAESAQLDLNLIPVQCFCEPCQSSFQPDGIFYECPHCHQLSWQVLQGKTLELASLEVS